MSIDSSIDDLLEGGAKAYQFPNIGDTCSGRVVSAQTKQQTNIDDGSPRFFPSGDPMMEIVVTVEMDDGEPSTLYFSGGNFEVAEGKGKSSLNALRDALDGRKLEVGGRLAKQYSGVGKRGKGNPPKLWTCAYQPPAPPAIDVNDSIL